MKKIRRQFIKDVVEAYKKNHKKEWEAFLEVMKFRKSSLNDKSFGELNGASEIRHAMSMPEGIKSAFDHVLKEEELPFGEPKGEIKWFKSKFPEFFISNKY